MTNKKVIVPPIKSQGIKTKLVPWIMELAPKAEGKWIEPFLGTGVVAFNSGYEKAILNDTNPHIITFYKGIQQGEITAPLMRHYLEQEGELLSKAGDNGYDHYRKVRARFNQEFSPYDFIFLSRAGFNGMMRFGKKGNWNIPFVKSQTVLRKPIQQKLQIKFQRFQKLYNLSQIGYFITSHFRKSFRLQPNKILFTVTPPIMGAMLITIMAGQNRMRDFYLIY